jgi:hypothetical protein
MARLITEQVVEVSPRTLENWPLSYKLVCGRAMYDPEEGLAYARQLVKTAPLYRGGRRRAVA